MDLAARDMEDTKIHSLWLQQSISSGIMNSSFSAGNAAGHFLPHGFLEPVCFDRRHIDYAFLLLKLLSSIL